jgi:hypothetical protein
MALILKTTGRSFSITPDHGREDFTVLQMQSFINSPTFEVIPARWDGEDIFIVTDEEGLPKHRPFNLQASRVARREIYGDVMIVRFEELGGKEDTGAPLLDL